jgi:Calreticulin family
MIVPSTYRRLRLDIGVTTSLHGVATQHVPGFSPSESTDVTHLVGPSIDKSVDCLGIDTHLAFGPDKRPPTQGIWTAPMIDNPDFKDDPELYAFPPTKYVGFELWQVKAGSIFDNIMLTDSLDEALKFAKDTWGKTIEAEKAAREKAEARPPATGPACQR